MATTRHTPAAGSGARVRVQKFGTFLSNMVMPNIGAFIAWGLITALFIEVGWLNLGGKGSLATRQLGRRDRRLGRLRRHRRRPRRR